MPRRHRARGAGAVRHGLAPILTQNILEGLARIAPQHRATFERNRRAFLGRLDGEMARWTSTLAPLKGAKVVVYHPDFIYFLTMLDEKVKVVLVEPWNDVKLAECVAQEAGARALVMASAVGAVKGADDCCGRP